MKMETPTPEPVDMETAFFEHLTYKTPVEIEGIAEGLAIIGQRYVTDGAAAERARIVKWLRHASPELQDSLTDAFDECWGPAYDRCAEKYGRVGVQPAFASWGPQFLAALADLIESTDAR